MKYIRAYCSYYKACPQEKLFYHRLTWWGFIRTCPTWRKRNTQLQPPLAIQLESRPAEGGGLGRDWEDLVKFTAQEYRITKRLSPNHRTAACFISPLTLPVHYWRPPPHLTNASLKASPHLTNASLKASLHLTNVSLKASPSPYQYITESLPSPYQSITEGLPLTLPMHYWRPPPHLTNTLLKSLLPTRPYSPFNKKLQDIPKGKKYNLKKCNKHQNESQIWQKCGNYQTRDFKIYD